MNALSVEQLLDKIAEVDHFRSLQQLSDHAKEHHDVVFYSSTTYSSQQVLCGRWAVSRVPPAIRVSPKKGQMHILFRNPIFWPKKRQKNPENDRSVGFLFFQFFLGHITCNIFRNRVSPVSLGSSKFKKKNWPPSAAFRDFFCKRSPDGPLCQKSSQSMAQFVLFVRPSRFSMLKAWAPCLFWVVESEAFPGACFRFRAVLPPHKQKKKGTLTTCTQPGNFNPKFAVLDVLVCCSCFQ